MANEKVHIDIAVNTVLGPIPPEKLGVVAVHEALLSIVPGAQYAPDITVDRSEIFDILAAKLDDFRAHGGGTVVDSTGMFHGRDLLLYEALSARTGVHIIASTGMGPEELLGGYFLTPQTNPPTPWPLERFADLFSKEVTEGMVVPRVERRAAAGIVATAADRNGITATEISLFKGSARAALQTGIPISIRFGTEVIRELNYVLEEGISADRVVVGGLDRKDAATAEAMLEVARRGAYVALDHVGQKSKKVFLDDEARVNLVLELIAAGVENRILLSSNSIGVAKGHDSDEVSLSYVLRNFVPLLAEEGVSDSTIRQILIDNPRHLLTVEPVLTRVEISSEWAGDSNV